MDFLLNLILKITQFKKKMVRDAKHPQKIKAREMRIKDTYKYFFKEKQVTKIDLSDGNAFYITPERNLGAKTVFYLHGGAYLYGISSAHWMYVKKMIASTNTNVMLVNYPLSNYREAYKMLDECYKWLTVKSEAKDIVFMGDSAGGGLALGFAQSLLVTHKPLPYKIILLSPWLDISMTDQYQKSIEKLDPILSIEGLRIAGEMFTSGISDYDRYLTSPLFGQLKGLPPIHVFTGTKDILNRDALRLKERCAQESVRIEYYEEKDKMHVWMLFPSKSARICTNRIFRLLS